MKAIVQDNFGPPQEVLTLKEIDKPVVGDDEALVRVHAASVHVGDYFTIEGLPKVMRPLFSSLRAKNGVPGADIAGTVEAVGKDATKFQPGDAVFGSYKGAFAEYASFPEDALALQPENLTPDQASAVGVSALTALQALRDQGNLQAGQQVLITGASGGVGTFAVQIAKSLGAEVTAVCSTRNMDMVRSLGADNVIDYTQEDFTEGDQRYDLILDNVGTRSLSNTRRVLKPAGTLVANGAPVGGWFGGLTRPIASFGVSLFVKQQAKPFVATTKPEDLATLKDLVEAGKLTPLVERTYPLTEAPAAVAHVGEGHAQGKTVITVEHDAT